jgi:hypothetical protein
VKAFATIGTRQINLIIKGDITMSDQTIPYIQRKAGDPWTVEDFHDLQTKVKQDIQGSINTAISQLDQVNRAGDSDKFGGKSPEEFAQALVDRVLAILPKRTGYMMLFKDLKVSEESVIEHQLGAYPLVDVYQLDYFRVISSEDEHIYETFTTFYLYHSSESKIRFRPEELNNAPLVSVEIDPEDGHSYRIPFERMLELYEVQYDDNSSLDDVETDFWKAFMGAPNDSFDDDQYCHSPWFDRCCREMRTIQYLKQRKEWDDMWFQVRPRKTINFRLPAQNDGRLMPWAPNNISVVHFDLNTVGLTLLQPTDLPANQITPPPLVRGFENYPTPEAIKDDHQKVLVLLKV